MSEAAWYILGHLWACIAFASLVIPAQRQLGCRQDGDAIMASLETTASGNFHVVFWFQGERYKRALRTKEQREADRRKARLEDTLRLVECGRIDLPKDIDVPLFLLSDGKLQQSTTAERTPAPPPPADVAVYLRPIFCIDSRRQFGSNDPRRDASA